MVTTNGEHLYSFATFLWLKTVIDKCDRLATITWNDWLKMTFTMLFETGIVFWRDQLHRSRALMPRCSCNDGYRGLKIWPYRLQFYYLTNGFDESQDVFKGKRNNGFFSKGDDIRHLFYFFYGDQISIGVYASYMLVVKRRLMNHLHCWCPCDC